MRLKKLVLDAVRNARRMGRSPWFDVSPETTRLFAAYKRDSLPRSVIFYTTHKCASVFVDHLLTTLSQKSSYRVVNYTDKIWNLGDALPIGSPYEQFLEQHFDSLYKKRGEIYAPQRAPLDFPGSENFRHIFFLRDPRDVLVSAYYSFGYSHALPKESKARQEVSARREKIQLGGIDTYALSAAEDWILPVYTEYANLRRSAESELYVTYDEFKDDTKVFLRRIVDYLELQSTHSVVEALAREASSVQKGAPRLQHKRSGRSRQWLKELKPETVDTLNEMLASVLDVWGFGPQ